MSVRVLSNTNFSKQSAACSWEWADVAGQHVWCLSVLPTSFIWRRNIKETSAFLTCNTELNTCGCHSADSLLECSEEQVLGLSSTRAPESHLAWLILDETNHRLTQLISFLWKLSRFSQCELARNSWANIIHTHLWGLLEPFACIHVSFQLSSFNHTAVSASKQLQKVLKLSRDHRLHTTNCDFTLFTCYLAKTLFHLHLFNHNEE